MISKKDMQALDKRAIEEFLIDSLLLMECAAFAIFDKIKNYDSYTIVCGTGNNGGDGLALARHLVLSGKNVKIFITGEPKSKENIKNYEILKRITREVYIIDEDLENLKKSVKDSDITVDSIFGVGLSKEILGKYREIIEIINSNANYIISVDIPSGIDSDTGEILGVSIKANKTIAIHDVKNGMNYENSGEIEKVYIGIPDERFRVLK